MRLAWVTDIHLNFLDVKKRRDFYQEILSETADAVLISGDISEAPDVEFHLKEMANEINIPIYFVLGNHDFYLGSIEQVRKEMTELTKDSSLLVWLGTDLKNYDPLLKEGIVILGKDSFADGRYGDYEHTRVRLNDHRYIKEFSDLSIFAWDLDYDYRGHLLKKMQKLADRDAKDLHAHLNEAIEKYHPKKIIVLVHVPPFEEACLFEGQRTTGFYLPFYSSKVTGKVLLKVAKKHKDIEFLVLCGHTHSQAIFQPLQNLTVKVGEAVYGRPKIEEVINL